MGLFGQYEQPDDGAIGPVTTPEQADAQPQQQPNVAAPQQTPDPTMVKAGVSSRGMTAGGMKRSAGLFGGADQAVNQFAQADNAVTAQQQQRNQQDYGGLEQATGTEVDAQKAFQQKDAELQQRVVDFNQHAANLEQRIAGESKAERAKYLASYQEQLAGVRQLAMQSGNPIGKLDASGAAGLMGAQFAQGFLAARGIQIDVTGQIDRWVDRSIQEHGQQVAQMRESANDTLHLYDLARQSSQDDYEARQRYRGFVIQGLQSSVQMNAARFQSDIAIAHAKEQVSKLQIEADQTERTIGDQHFNRVHQMMTTEYDKAFKQGSLAIESQKLDLEKQKIAAAKAVKEAKLPAYVVDPTQYAVGDNGKRASGSKVVAVYNPDAPGVTKAAENISNASTYHGNIQRGIERLRDLKPDSASWASIVSKTDSPEYRRFDTARNELIADLLLANSGKAVTDAEFQRYKSMLQDNSKWQKGNNDALFGELETSSRRKLNAVFEGEQAAGNIRTLAAGEQVDPRFGAQGRYMPYEAPLDPRGASIDDADMHGGKPVQSFGEVEAVAAQSDDKKTTKPSKAYAELVGQSPDEQQPHNTVPVELLARVFLDPKSARTAFAAEAHGLPDDDNTVKRQAIDSLQTIAAGKDPMSSSYAQIMLDKLENDPDGVRELLLPQFTAKYADPTKDPRRK